MKKTLSFILAFCLLCGVFTTGFAATITESGESAEMAVTYGVDMSYIVTIPEAVQLTAEGEVEMTVEAYDVLLPSGTTLSLTIEGDANAENQWCVTDTADASNSLTYQITDDYGDPVNPGNLVLCVYAGESGIDARLYFSLLDDVVKAGTYTGTLTFNVSLSGGGVYSLGTKNVHWDDMLEVDATITNNEECLAEILDTYGIDCRIATGLEGYDFNISRVTPWLIVDSEVTGLEGKLGVMLITIEEEDEVYNTFLAYLSQEESLEFQGLGHVAYPVVIDNEYSVQQELMQAFKKQELQLSTNVQQKYLMYDIYCEQSFTEGSASYSWGQSIYAVKGMTWEEHFASVFYPENFYATHETVRVENGYIYIDRTYATHILTYASTGEPVHVTDVIVSENVDQYIFVQQ